MAKAIGGITAIPETLIGLRYGQKQGYAVFRAAKDYTKKPHDYRLL